MPERAVITRENDHGVFTALYHDAGLEIGEGWEAACRPVFSFAARREGRLLGAATVSRRMDRWILDYVAVLPQERQLGLGRLLVHSCMDEAAAQGADELWLAARTPGFFRAIGAQETGGQALLKECLSCGDFGKECQPKEMKLNLRFEESK